MEELKSIVEENLVEPKVEEKLDFESFRSKLGRWAERFKPFIESQKMFDLMQRIKKDAFEEKVDKNGNKKIVRKAIIVPESVNTFRAFTSVHPELLRVMFILMDPYPRRYSNGEFQATGIAMDCSNSPDGKLQPSLEYFYKAMETELDKKVEWSKSLEYLHEQGVMMYNSDLTCKLNKTESHSGYWVDFQKYFLEEVLSGHTGIIYVLCGKASQKLKRFINPLGNYIFELTHPSSAQYGSGVWNSKGIFKTINRILKDNNDTQIFWDKREWDEYKTPPF